MSDCMWRKVGEFHIKIGWLDWAARNRIDVKVARLKVGNTGGVEPVGDGVHEVKIDYGPGYRVYFGNTGSAFVLLLIGGDKKSQARDIDKAKAFWKDYKKRTNQA